MLLLVGGSKDHNINRLAETAKMNNVPFRLFYTDINPPLRIEWEPGESSIRINDEIFEAAGTALFTRYDVFSTMGDNVPEGQSKRNGNWFDAVKGWALANPEVGLLNRGNENMEVNKPRVLKMAKEIGFSLPRSWITNDFNRFADRDNYIAKPVSGGEHTKLLSELDEVSERPWIVQEKLDYPELRLFRAGNEFFGLTIVNNTLDSRASNNTLELAEANVSTELVEQMRELTDMLGLDYAAADFKTCAATGELKFLEVNTMPMMTGYDNVLRGYLSLAMIDTLESLTTQPQEKAPQRAPRISPNV